MSVSRRNFIGATATAVVAAGTRAKGKVFGANDAVNVCCIGINGQGGSHMNDLLETEGAEVVALCDVDEKVLDRRSRECEKKSGKMPKLFKDPRDVMADEAIDAITIATPNHWHSLLTIWGCQAGKDVYVEKPLSHNIYEGQLLAYAAQKLGRVVQHGTQSRSSASWQRDIKLMNGGFIGKIIMAKGFTYKNGNRHAIGHGEAADPPPELDWDLWQGPRPTTQYLQREGGKSGLFVHYNWHWTWPYGNGEIGNQGVHQMDVAVWGLGKDLAYPVEVYSSGGRWAWDDDGETPNTQTTTMTYDDGAMLVFEVRNLGSYEEAGQTTGNHFFGEEGYYVQGKGFFDYRKHEPIPLPDDVETPRGASKWQNWLKAIHSRNPEDNVCDGAVGACSSAHCHLGNVAYRLGRALKFDAKTMRFVNDDDANGLISEPYRDPFTLPELG